MKNPKNHIIPIPQTSENTSNKGSTLLLPRKSYGPLCLRILDDFRKHFNLPKYLKVPEDGIQTHIALSRIFDMMVTAMGEEKRLELLQDIEDSKRSLPPSCL